MRTEWAGPWAITTEAGTSMTYRIARGGQTFGPYTEAEVRQYIASGNIGYADLVQAEATQIWTPVSQLFPPTTEAWSAPPIAAQPPKRYADPPDLPWWAVLVLTLITTGVFLVVWDIVQSSWLKRMERSTTAFLFYIGVAILYLFKLPGILSTMTYNIFGGAVEHTHAGSLGGLSFLLAIVARFIFRRELLHHFNHNEGIALRLNGLWTLVFGGIYFQFHFNRINQIKRATNTSIPVAS